MKQDEIIEMARKIATEASKVGPYRTWTHEHAMSLIMRLVEVSAAKEREACAKVCDGVYYQNIGPEFGEVRYGIAACSAAIRARGEE